GINLATQLRRTGGPRPISVYLQAVICADQAAKDGLIEWRGVRTDEATYAASLDGPWLLYDNRKDPFQQRNLVGERPDLQRQMERALGRWMTRTHDVLEPKEAVLERYGLTALWEERAAMNRRLRDAGRPRSG
ncbi:MAG TPA: hypothetical protein VFN74_02530, partial [Chloroflexota bacterium]|nr:hypothetical protein [Chloroflexota bacterium]